MRALVLAVALVALALCARGMRLTVPAGSKPSIDANSTVVAMTDKGPVVGFQNASSRVWKGIPFAAPPVGALRWQPPQEAQAWGPNPRMALEYAPACPQHCSLPPNFCPNSTAEDCLHLNVWTPRVQNNPDGLWPVMVFFAGGAFFQGDGGVPIYSGDTFVNTTEVVLVTGSYRLGALGWAVYGDQIVGNYGLQDQRAVLRWVQTNVKNFGGDPSQITIFGESAGAQSIGAHLASPQSVGLFHKAVMESNPYALEFKTSDEAYEDGIQLAYYLGCLIDGQDNDKLAVPPSSSVRSRSREKILSLHSRSVGNGKANAQRRGLSKRDIVSCMMSKSADEVVDAQGKVAFIPFTPSAFSFDLFLQWTPTIDGKQLTMQPLDAFISGDYNKVPIMLGSNANEGIMFVYQGFGSPLSYDEYLLVVAAAFREEAPTVLEYYPSSPSSSDTRMDLAQLITEYLFNCATRRAAEAIAARQEQVYLYYFNQSLSFDGYGPHYQFCVGYACHGTELVYLFGTARQAGFNFTRGESVLSYDMMTYWSGFAKSPDGSPNFGGKVSVDWEPFTSANLNDVLLKIPVKMESKILQQHCNLWDKLGYDW